MEKLLSKNYVFGKILKERKEKLQHKCDAVFYLKQIVIES